MGLKRLVSKTYSVDSTKAIRCVFLGVQDNADVK